MKRAVIYLEDLRKALYCAAGKEFCVIGTKNYISLEVGQYLSLSFVEALNADQNLNVILKPPTPKH